MATVMMPITDLPHGLGDCATWDDPLCGLAGDLGDEVIVAVVVQGC